MKLSFTFTLCQMKLKEATEYDDLEALEVDEVFQLKLLDADKFAHGFTKNGSKVVCTFWPSVDSY